MTPCRFLRPYTPRRVRNAAFFNALSGSAVFAFLLAASAAPLFSAPVAAQPARPVTVARSLPILTLSSAILPNGAGTLTLSLPVGTPLPDKTRVALFEAGRPALVADVTRRFTATGNAIQTTLAIEGASPGRYEVRVVSNDKARTVLTQPAPLLVPGVEREPGWWIFNGSIVMPPAATPPTPDTNAIPSATTLPATASLPLFIPGLRRDLSAKPKPITRDVALAVPPSFKLWTLPTVSELTRPNYDFGALQSQLTIALTDARTRGDVGYAGFVTTLYENSVTTLHGDLNAEATRAAVARLQTLRNAVAPDAALVLKVQSSSDDAQLVDFIAPLYDAVQVVQNVPAGYGSPAARSTGRGILDDRLWGVKIARRIAEDQPNFDLPIICGNDPDKPLTESGLGSQFRSQNDLQFLTAGANLILSSQANLDAVYQRNAPLFVGSVTLEDAGVLPISNFALAGVERLRTAGRVPQYARVIPLISESDKNKKPQPETFYARIDENTTAVQLEALRRSAAAGGRVYIEGSPDPSSVIATRMGELGGGTLSPLPNKQQETNTLLKLSDPWFFGTLRNTELGVTQRAIVKLASGTMAGQTKAQEGLDQLTSPRIVATLADGSPGMIVNPVGKGQVLWMPYLWNLPPSANEVNQARGDVGSTSSQLLRYDQAISGWLGPALVQLPPDAARALRIMVRRSPKGALLVSLINATNAAITTPLTVGGAPTVCLDLFTEQDFAVKTSGFDGTATVTVPANGAVLLACALDRKALEDERNAPRLKAKLK